MDNSLKWPRSNHVSGQTTSDALRKYREVFFMKIWLNFFISKSGCKYSYTNYYIFAITLVTQDDHLTAGAWAAPDMKRKNTRR